jgi:hypothetical protein
VSGDRSGSSILHQTLPKQLFVHGQHSKGDRHMYASRTRFICEALLPSFERTAWPVITTGRSSHARQAPQIDIQAHMRAHVALRSVALRFTRKGCQYSFRKAGDCNMETAIWVAIGIGVLYLIIRFSLAWLFRQERYK